MADEKRRRWKKSEQPEETVIKHTAGGEMPDPDLSTQHRFMESDFDDIGESGSQDRVSRKGGRILDQAKGAAQAVKEKLPRKVSKDLPKKLPEKLKERLPERLRDKSEVGLVAGLPSLFLLAGLGIGVYFLIRKSDRVQDLLKRGRRVAKERFSEEGRRAMEVDDVQPSRLMGA